jgi:hypothetical protein
MKSFFCKVEDLNGKQYILTDKNKQPLIALLNTCFIPNGKKFLNNPELLVSTLKEIEIGMKNTGKNNTFESDLFIDTKIPYAIKIETDKVINVIVNKSDIDFNIYDIATINKDIVIKNKEDNDKELTRIEIENNYFMLHSIDKNNNDYYEKMKQKEIELKSIGVVEPPLNILSEYITELYNYYQKLFTKQDITKLVPTDCVVGNWSDCLNNQKTRTIIPATNGGKACTPDENNLPLTQTCQPPSPSPSPSPPLPPSPTIKSSDNNNMYIGIGIFVFFIFAIAFWFYISQPQPQLKPKPK